MNVCVSQCNSKYMQLMLLNKTKQYPEELCYVLYSLLMFRKCHSAEKRKFQVPGLICKN